MIERTELKTTVEDHDHALIEVGFLLEVLSETITQVVGQSTASLGIAAGKHMAKKMPIYLKDPSVSEAVTALAGKLKEGFEIRAEENDGGADLHIGRCAVRDVCKQRGIELGGQLCTMFHYYLAGMVAELRNRPARAGNAQPGAETCIFRLDSK